MADLTICRLKLCKTEQLKRIDLTEFVNTADLTQKQLYNYNNEIQAFEDETASSLIFAAMRHLVSIMSTRVLKHHGTPNASLLRTML